MKVHIILADNDNGTVSVTLSGDRKWLEVENPSPAEEAANIIYQFVKTLRI